MCPVAFATQKISGTISLALWHLATLSACLEALEDRLVQHRPKRDVKLGNKLLHCTMTAITDQTTYSEHQETISPVLRREPELCFNANIDGCAADLPDLTAAGPAQILVGTNRLHVCERFSLNLCQPF